MEPQPLLQKQSELLKERESLTRDFSAISDKYISARTELFESIKNHITLPQGYDAIAEEDGLIIMDEQAIGIEVGVERKGGSIDNPTHYTLRYETNQYEISAPLLDLCGQLNTWAKEEGDTFLKSINALISAYTPLEESHYRMMERINRNL